MGMRGCLRNQESHSRNRGHTTRDFTMAKLELVDVKLRKPRVYISIFSGKSYWLVLHTVTAVHASYQSGFHTVKAVRALHCHGSQGSYCSYLSGFQIVVDVRVSDCHGCQGFILSWRSAFHTLLTVRAFTLLFHIMISMALIPVIFNHILLHMFTFLAE